MSKEQVWHYPTNWLQKSRRARELQNHRVIDHNGKVDLNDPSKIPQNLKRIDFYREAGVPEEQINEVFIEDGALRPYGEDPEKEPLVDFLNLTPINAHIVAKDRVSPLLSLVDVSLSHGYSPNGFHIHGPEHAADVGWQSRDQHKRLLKNIKNGSSETKYLEDHPIESKLSHQQLEVCREISVVIHDAMIALKGRKDHNIGINEVINAYFPELNQPEMSLMRRIVRRTVFLHDEKAARQVFDGFREQGLTEEESYKAFGRFAGSVGLSVFIGDKHKNVDRSRVTPLETTRDALNKDPHLRLAVFSETQTYRYNGHSTKPIHFDPNIDSNFKHIQEYGRTHSDKGKDRVWGVDAYHKLHRDMGVPYFFTWMGEYWHQMGSRAAIEAIAQFAAHPKIESYTFSFIDRKDFQNGTGLTLAVDIKRGHVEESIQWIEEHFSADMNNTEELSSDELFFRMPIPLLEEALDWQLKFEADDTYTVTEQVHSYEPVKGLSVKYHYVAPEGYEDVLDNYIKFLFTPKEERKPEVT